MKRDYTFIIIVLLGLLFSVIFAIVITISISKGIEQINNKGLKSIIENVWEGTNK